MGIRQLLKTFDWWNDLKKVFEDQASAYQVDSREENWLATVEKARDRIGENLIVRNVY